MQQFFLLCTMLIIASEAFPEDLSRRGIPKKFGKKTSGFAAKSINARTGRLLPGNVNLPTFFVPWLYEPPFLVPIRTKDGRYSSLQRIRKRLGKKFQRKRKWTPAYPRDMTDSFTYSEPEFSEYFENPNSRGFSSSYSRSALTGNRYTVQSYRGNQDRAINRHPRRRLSPLERRYLRRLRCKNKRNANSCKREGGSEGDTENEDYERPRQSSESPQNNQLGDLSPPQDERNYKKDSEHSEGNCFCDALETFSKNPRMSFKSACEPSVSKSSLVSEEEAYAKKEKGELLDTVRYSPDDCSNNIVRLKEMLEQVQTLLKDDSNKNTERSRYRSSQMESKLQKNDKHSNPSLQDKIDAAIPILMQISEDLIKISNVSRVGHVEQANPRCSADGTWTSTELGIDMTFKTLPNMMLKVTASPNTEGMLNRKWSIQGLTLSKEGGPLILAAVCPQKRKIASFIGQCKMCKDQDIMFGAWTTFTFVHKYTDLWKATDFRLDVLKKKMTI